MAAHLTGVAAITYLIFTFLLGLAVIKGPSMQPTLEENDLCLFLRVGEVQRGDIVFLRPAGKQKEYVKRVVGIPGDTIDMAGGQVVLNGTPLQEPGVLGPTAQKPGGISYPITLRENEYFVLGDNRGNSEDSRDFGPVTRQQLDGHSLLVFHGISQGGEDR